MGSQEKIEKKINESREKVDYSEIGTTKIVELNNVKYIESYITVGRDVYFPVLTSKKRLIFSEVVRSFESLGYLIQVDEEAYKKLINTQKMPAICPKKHGLIDVSITELKRGGTCCKQCGDENRKLTNLRNLGVDNAFKSEVIKEKIRQTNLKTRKVEYAAQDPMVKEKIRQTNLITRKVEYPSQDPDVKEKIRLINLERRNVENPFQCPIIKEQIKQIHLEKRGVENPMQDPKVKEKFKQTCMEKYGVSNPMKDSEVQAKACETNIGVPYPMQDALIREKSQKSSFLLKSYIFPSGREIFIQGYENFCIDDLLFYEEIEEDDICSDHEREKMPIIWYDFKEKKSRYFPDLYLPKENRIIEVKSQYTYDLHKEQNLIKQKACKEQGFLFEFRIYSNKGELLETII